MLETQALAIFGDSDLHPLSRFLKRGFRHVFAAVRHDHYWAVIDGADGLAAIYVAGIDDLAAHYRDQGYTVVEISERQRLRTLLMPASCVSLTKAVIGIRSRAITPWQLFKHLEKQAHATDSGFRGALAPAAAASGATHADGRHHEGRARKSA